MTSGIFEKRPMTPLVPTVLGEFSEYFITMCAHYAGEKYRGNLSWEEYGLSWQQLMDIAFDSKVNLGSSEMMAALEYHYGWLAVLAHQEVRAVPLDVVGEIKKIATPTAEIVGAEIKGYEQYKQEYQFSKDFADEVRTWK